MNILPSTSKRDQTAPTRMLDPNAALSYGFNNPAGAFKQVKVGPHLIPFTNDGSTYTVDASGGVNLGALGQQLAIYNNSGTVGSVTISPASAASLAPGVVDGNNNVGVPCMPNGWTYLSCGDSSWVITSASTLLVFIIEDDTVLKGNPQALAAISPT
jgi:hypothetical protein